VTERWQLDVEEIRAARPRHLLFLCVANSARSQMAEAIARALAPTDVKISSAGSQPTSIHPIALAALGEIDVDGSRQSSKSVASIPSDDVDVVITLCADEVCPAWLGRARRYHWPLPDPAAARGSPEDQLVAFRPVRDELRRRIAAIFSR